MSRRRTGYPEQPWNYYDNDWVEKCKGNPQDKMDRRAFTSSHATKYIVGDSVLDICCGCGQVANMIGNRRYLGIDFSPAQLEWAREHNQNPNASFLLEDIHALPCDIGKFDTVILGEALEHFEDPESIVELAHRHAKQRIVITLPTKNGSCHVWECFEEPDIRELLKDGVGGKVTVCKPFKCLVGTNRWVAVKELYPHPRILVTGAGGFIGSHLVCHLKEQGYWVRGVDLKYPDYMPSVADEFFQLDLTRGKNAEEAVQGIDWAFALAADFGGMQYIDNPANQARVLYNNTLINLNTIEASREAGVKRYLFTSSVCVYPTYMLENTNPLPLTEEEVYPALPQRTYGWEKLHAEHAALAYQESFGLDVRIVRLQNTYGPYGAWYGLRAKAPADLCRKVAHAKLAGVHEVEVWGDGLATRPFMFVIDCVNGIYKLMCSDYCAPVTLGPDRAISINELVDIIADAADWKVDKVCVAGPQGVRGRNFDHTKAREILDWEPKVSLEEGIAETYRWIEQQII